MAISLGQNNLLSVFFLFLAVPDCSLWFVDPTTDINHSDKTILSSTSFSKLILGKAFTDTSHLSVFNKVRAIQGIRWQHQIELF